MKSKFFNKYTLTLALAVVVLLFVGQESVWDQAHNLILIHALEQERDDYQSRIDEANRALGSVESTDSLERFARETYYMHTPQEKVYLVDE